MTDKHADETPDADLLRLAERHRVATTFTGWNGGEEQVGRATLLRVLKALGVSAGTDAEVQRSLAEADAAPWRRPLPPTVVLRSGRPSPVAVHLPAGVRAEISLRLEDGTQQVLDLPAAPSDRREVDGRNLERYELGLPGDLPLGWHRLELAGGGLQAEAALVVTPDRLSTADRLREHRQWGLMAQLYSVRSSKSWGIGDLGDLAELAAIPAGGFLLINPLHAAEPVPPLEDSPYLPATRRFFNPLYIRVEDIPEYALLSEADRQAIETAAAELGRANTSNALLDRNATYAAKLEALELIHQVPLEEARRQDFERFVRDEGPGLADFALWCALAAELQPGDPRWEEAQTPDSPYVREHREHLEARAGFYKWLQWICDGQLAAAGRAADGAGMPIGIVHDLAVGVHPQGADAWSLRGVLAQGISVGAPPDMFNQQGQDWSQPPWHPQRLAEAGYAPYRDMVRTILRHAGGIRVDHILGLFRLWWIPEGGSPAEGAYVYYDHEALVGILALEAERAGAVVVGEDLGVFEPWVQDYLAERGVLGTSILWFERSGDEPSAPEQYREGALTTIGTHDLPPTAGYLAGEHVELRSSLGLLGRPVEEERAADEEARRDILGLLDRLGLLPDGAVSPASGLPDGEEQIRQVLEALHRFIAQTPSVLLGVSLVDAVGDRRTQNQPGTSDEYPNWRIPLTGPDGKAVLLDDLAGNPRFRNLVALMRDAVQGEGR